MGLGGVGQSGMRWYGMGRTGTGTGTGTGAGAGTGTGTGVRQDGLGWDGIG